MQAVSTGDTHHDPVPCFFFFNTCYHESKQDFIKDCQSKCTLKSGIIGRNIVTDIWAIRIEKRLGHTVKTTDISILQPRDTSVHDSPIQDGVATSPRFCQYIRRRCPFYGISSSSFFITSAIYRLQLLRFFFKYQTHKLAGQELD